MNCTFQKNKLQFLRVLIIFSCIIPIILFDTEHYQKVNFSSETREQILTYKNIYNIEEGKSYLIYLSDNFSHTTDYYYYICKYDFRSTNIKIIKNFSHLESMDKIFDYDYFVIVNKDEEVLEFLNTIGGSVDTNVIRFR